MKKIFILLCTFVLMFPMNSEILQANEKENLMIVAHPDDETIWGGAHLMKGNYTVLCITNGNNKKRKAEFNQVMKKAGSKGMILSFPDKTNGKRDNWKSCKKEIKNKIKKVIDSKDWDEIITHNPNGEYGHIHHKMVSKFVTNLLKSEKKTKKLIYFGRYTKRAKKAVLKKEKAISKKAYTKKLKLCTLYSSQDKVMDHLHHMLRYENWIPYSNWDRMNKGE